MRTALIPATKETPEPQVLAPSRVTISTISAIEELAGIMNDPALRRSDLPSYFAPVPKTKSLDIASICARFFETFCMFDPLSTLKHTDWVRGPGSEYSCLPHKTPAPAISKVTTKIDRIFAAKCFAIRSNFPHHQRRIRSTKSERI